MTRVTPLPPHLVDRYRNWSNSSLDENRDRFRTLADEGQEPDTMVIACCDSRVQVTEMLGSRPGEAFIHRNIANLVPHVDDALDHSGTAAALEYAVSVLKVKHVVVMGHSGCGGVAACCDICEGNAPQLDDAGSPIGKWVKQLRRAHTAVATVQDRGARLTAMEKAGVQMSLDNLQTYPFIREGLGDGTLQVHGLWIDVGSGTVETYDADMNSFVPV